MIDLGVIIHEYPQCLKSRAKLSAILHDLYPQENREINLILASYECGIPDRISNLTYIDAALMNKLINKLEKEYGFQREYAKKSIESWARGYLCTIDDVASDDEDNEKEKIPDCTKPGVVYAVSCCENGAAGLYRLTAQLSKQESPNNDDRSDILSQVMYDAIQNAITNFEDSSKINQLWKCLTEKIIDDYGTEHGPAMLWKLYGKAKENEFRSFNINYTLFDDTEIPKQVSVATLISIFSSWFSISTMPGLVVTGDVTKTGEILKVEKMTEVLQLCIESGAKTVLVPALSTADLFSVPANLIGKIEPIFYYSAEQAILKSLNFHELQ